MSGITEEALIEAAFTSNNDIDPILLPTVRGDMVSNYATKQGFTAMTRLVLQKLLSDRPEDPVKYLIEQFEDWKPRQILMLGPPASGKKTLCETLAGRLGLEHVCPNDLILGLENTESRIGEGLKTMTAAGHEVPENLVQEIVHSRLKEHDCQDKGWIMEGWPRSVKHAEDLITHNLGPTIIIVLELPDDVVEDRVAFRVFNPETGRLYHMTTDPPPLGQSRLCTIRPQENTEEILARIQAYNDNLPRILSVLEGEDKNFRIIRQDVNCTSEEFDSIADSLARAIGV